MYEGILTSQCLPEKAGAATLPSLLSPVSPGVPLPLSQGPRLLAWRLFG